MERHDTLLIFSRSAENRAYLRDALEEGFNLLEAVNIKQTMLLLKQNINCIAALLLDVSTMTDVDKEMIRQEENVALLHCVQIIAFTEDEDTVRMNRAFSLNLQLFAAPNTQTTASGDLSPDNPLYGLYLFKKGFGGDLVEFCGEFEMIYNKTADFIVNKALGTARTLRRKLKQLKNRDQERKHKEAVSARGTNTTEEKE